LAYARPHFKTLRDRLGDPRRFIQVVLVLDEIQNISNWSEAGLSTGTIAVLFSTQPTPFTTGTSREPTASSQLKARRLSI
jgi:hypothetical protein